jgi:hypothetical protein
MTQNDNLFHIVSCFFTFVEVEAGHLVLASPLDLSGEGCAAHASCACMCLKKSVHDEAIKRPLIVFMY